ncbi:SH3 domain-containing protein [Altericista sp. CCNU0014]|uniref:SH3 domain-containing protein n=1 Tax=Altericista sp. CCNU0014 TaxID=3082949 RepID=UPI00384CFC7C
MRWSNVAQSTLGILLGLLTVTVAVVGTSFLLLQQLSRSPEKPNFAEAKKEPSQLDIRSEDDKTYPALVVYQQGLILRSKPDASSTVVDKLQFNDTVVVVGESDDKQWQQVRFESKGVEGWVRAGNIKRAQ